MYPYIYPLLCLCICLWFIPAGILLITLGVIISYGLLKLGFAKAGNFVSDVMVHSVDYVLRTLDTTPGMLLFVGIGVLAVFLFMPACPGPKEFDVGMIEEFHKSYPDDSKFYVIRADGDTYYTDSYSQDQTLENSFGTAVVIQPESVVMYDKRSAIKRFPVDELQRLLAKRKHSKSSE